MAQVLLDRRLRERGVEAVVESAGISALVGYPADPLAREVMAHRGFDLSTHRARQLTAELVRSFPLVLVMEEGQQRSVEAMDTSSRGRVHRVGRVGRFDVPDPYRQGRDAFESAFALIDRGLLELDKIFWSRS